MMYPYITLDDDTEIVHSEMKEDGSEKVYIETPDDKGGFYNATCILRHLWRQSGDNPKMCGDKKRTKTLPSLIEILPKVC